MRSGSVWMMCRASRAAAVAEGVADALKIEQRSIGKRLMISTPLFAASIAMLVWQMDNPDSFNVIWNYFGWANQTLSVFTLWAITVYLALKKRFYVITLIPAIFMTCVCTSFLFVSKIALGLPSSIGYFAGLIMAALCTVAFYRWYYKKFSPTFRTNKYGESVEYSGKNEK